MNATDLDAALVRLTDDERLELDALLAPPETYRQYIARVAPHYQFYRHTEAMIALGQQIVDGDVTRAMVFCPPRLGKSETFSRLLPAYYLHRWPDRWAALSSYGASLANSLSRAARENFTRGGGTLRGDAAAVQLWETGKGGGFWCCGVGGPATGKGFHLGIVDDPIKDALQAKSPTHRDRQRDWWRSTWYSRRQSGAALIVMMTRWDMDDLAGWLLEQELDSEGQPEGWTVLSLPEEALDEAATVPPTCTLLPDWREPGEPLCPERRPLKELAKIKRRIGDYYWWALHQQRPRPPEGSMFKRGWLEVVPAAPPGRSIRYWDYATTRGGEGARTAGCKMTAARGLDGTETYFIEDVTKGRWAAPERDAIVKQTAEVDGKKVLIRGEQEPGSSGKDMAGAAVRMLAGFNVQFAPVTGDKELRAQPLASQAAIGNVKLVRGDWNKEFLDELADFPHGRTKDQVDAASGAFNALATALRPRIA